MKLLAPVLVLCLLGAGCSSLTTHQVTDYHSFRRFYVEHRLTDDHHIDESIVAELKARGYAAACGPLTMMPDGIEVVVTYQDRWEWDFKSYLIDLTVNLRANYTDKPLVTGHYHQASADTKSPAEVVHKIIAALFPPR